MRVAILGGYGVFGSRLARLLLRDGHDVVVAGRNQRKAAEFCAKHGGVPLQIDTSKNLDALITARADVVIDAAGPFQSYDPGALPVARFCIRNRINYLDLSDDAQFTTSIQSLDAQAKAAGCFVISGVSSVPGLSAAVVSALSADMDSIEAIETAIMPGNRAPRGRSVVAAILSQVGLPLRLWQGGRWQEATCWSDRKAYRIGNGARRQAWLISAPDLVLFPKHFAAGSVVFRAGLELSLLNYCLSAFAALQSRRILRANPAVTGLGLFVARLLRPFGTDLGAMVVEVSGRQSGESVIKRWELLATEADGPFIPTVTARALLRNPERIAPGARACLAEPELAEIEAVISDLAVTTRIEQKARVNLFRAALKDRWDNLPATLQRMHSGPATERFSGIARVERGTGIIARIAAWLFGFPDAGDGVALNITKTRTSVGETWQRDFGGKLFRSALTPARPYHVNESFGPFRYELELPVANGAMHLAVRRGWFLGMPLPRFLLPVSDSREYARDGQFHFDVGMYAPLGAGLIVRYTGTVTQDGDS